LNKWYHQCLILGSGNRKLRKVGISIFLKKEKLPLKIKDILKIYPKPDNLSIKKFAVKTEDIN
jgi:hypothetical protein